MISPLPVKIIAKKLLTHQLSYLCRMLALLSSESRVTDFSEDITPRSSLLQQSQTTPARMADSETYCLPGPVGASKVSIASQRRQILCERIALAGGDE